jgi:hypothetical protein
VGEINATNLMTNKIATSKMMSFFVLLQPLFVNHLIQEKKKKGADGWELELTVQQMM